ncbi:hypothetical protein Tco_1388279, partial [Tanacetum coccineum]
SCYSRTLIEVWADEELRDNIVVVMPKLFGDGFYTCNVHVELDVVKNMKKPIRTTRGVLVSPEVTFVDDEGKPLAKVDSSDDHDSEDDISSVDKEIENFLVSKKVGYGTDNLLEKWRENYKNDDYDFDPYDDDMYEGLDTLDKIQDTYDILDIKFRGRKKK